MRKLLLTLLALVALLPASAAEVKFDFQADSYGQPVAIENEDGFLADGCSFSNEAVTITVNHLKGNGCRFWKSSTQDFRVNKESGITVSVENGVISKIDFTGVDLTALSVEGTKLSNSKAASWSGEAESVKIVNTTSGKNGKTVKLYTMTVTFEQKAVGPVQPQTCVVTLDGNVVEPGVVEVAESGLLTINSEGAESILVSKNGEEATIESNPCEIAVSEYAVYSFQGVSGDLKSEVVSFTFEIDDLGWKTVIENGVAETYTYDFADLTSLETSKELTLKDSAYSLMGVVVSSGNVELTVSTGTTEGRIYVGKDKTTDLRVYRGGGSLNFSTKNGEAIMSIAIVRSDSDTNNGSLYYNEVAIDYDSKSKTFTWVAPESKKCTSVSIQAGEKTAGKNVYIKGITVTVGGGVTYMVAAPVWLLNGEVLNCGGDFNNAKEVKENDVIRIESHKRTHLHYSHNGDVVAANVKSLMSAVDAEINWTPVTGDEKHVYEYVVPANLDHDVVMYAKAVKGDYEPVVTRLLLDANGTVTSVDGVGADASEAAPEYFNLQGVRVANPSNGLFIKRTGNKVEKVMM